MLMVLMYDCYNDADDNDNTDLWWRQQQSLR